MATMKSNQVTPWQFDHGDLDADSSVVSFGEGPVLQKTPTKFAYTSNEKVGSSKLLAVRAARTLLCVLPTWLACRSPQVDHEQFQRMVKEHREARQQAAALEMQCKKCVRLPAGKCC